ncbi:MAG: tail fiber protein [Clostridia bacterium]|nr:tail fiber protein [Clostridia bacterium]
MEPILGQVQLFAFGFEPMGWILCDGRTLNIQQNSALYSLLGTTYGGNGSTTFGIPNLMNANPVPAAGSYYNCYYIAVEGIYPSRY